MKQIIRKTAKLFLPGWFMHWWLPHRYGIQVKQVSDSGLIRFLALLAPYAVSAILQQRDAEDRRVVKYFFPYGMMCRHVESTYGISVRNKTRDGGWLGALRSVFPYGLVLWWDREDRRLGQEGASKCSKAKVAARSAEKPQTDAMTPEVAHALMDRLDRQELLSLRILAGGGSPSVDTFSVASSGQRRDDLMNERLTASSADYIAFLDAGDRFADEKAIELLALSAKVEDAAACGGRSPSSDAAPCLSGFVFDRKWLLASGLRFCSATGVADSVFLEIVEASGGRLFFTGRELLSHDADQIQGFTAHERRIDALSSFVKMSRLLPSLRNGDSVKAALARAVGKNRRLLREAVWAGCRPDPAKAELVRELARNLGSSRLEEELCRPLVSVVVPAYNIKPHLPKCLDSLLGQTLAQIEIVVVDDGSTDGTAQIADGYAAQNPQIKVIHRPNGGLSAARNTGMAVATGKYIGFVDGDDWVEPDMFMAMGTALEGDPSAEFAVCGAKVEFSYKADAADEHWAQKYFDLPPSGGCALTPRVVHDINSTAWTKLYRRDFLRDNDIRFPEGMVNEDEVFFFFTMGKARRIQIVNKPYYHYVRNDGGIMAKQAEMFDADGTLPDSIERAFPLVAAYLKADDRKDLMGVFFRHVCGAANRYSGERANRRVAQLLHEADFFYYREFLDDRDLGWCRRKLDEVHNFNASGLPPFRIDSAMMPRLRERRAEQKQPALTFIVPVFNQERYLAYCLESLKRQTEQNIEIICVDDGSVDHSWRLMQQYAEADGRIRIFRQENAGVSAARNRALSQARGRYIAFVDADDFVERTMASEVVAKMDRLRLDACPIDFSCFDYQTHQRVDHYWRLANHRSDYPAEPVFSFDELKSVAFFGGAAGSVWSRRLLDDKGLRFPDLVNNEDLMFSLRAWLAADRLGVADSPYYHYRRGNPASAVSNRATAAGDATVIKSFREMAALFSEVKKSRSRKVARLVAERLIVECLYHGARPRVLAYLQAEGFEALGFDPFRPPEHAVTDIWRRYDALRRQAPAPAFALEQTSAMVATHMQAKGRCIAERIEQARRTSKKDLYIVTGQLNSVANEPIDSWTFFRWLQANGIPSRYVMWGKHKMYARLKEAGELKDVIALSGNGVDNFEFLEKCEKELVRCRVVAQENGAINGMIRKWLYYLPDCEYAYLEHGIKFWKYTADMGRYFAGFNVINNSSVFEKELLESTLPGHFETGRRPRCIVGGLPRLDLMRDEREAGRKERYVFIMFTWRATFNGGQDVLEKSAYYHGIRALMSENNVRRLAQMGVKVVLSAHHHLVNRVKNLSFGPSVRIVPQDEVAYWKSHADCCITDYSSISFDFLFQGKPAVYWVPDREDPLLVESDYRELVEAEHRKVHIFNVVDSVDAVIDLVVHYARTDFKLEPEKQKVADRFFAHKTEICRHLYAALEAESAASQARDNV